MIYNWRAVDERERERERASAVCTHDASVGYYYLLYQIFPISRKRYSCYLLRTSIRLHLSAHSFSAFPPAIRERARGIILLWYMPQSCSCMYIFNVPRYASKSILPHYALKLTRDEARNLAFSSKIAIEERASSATMYNLSR